MEVSIPAEGVSEDEQSTQQVSVFGGSAWCWLKCVLYSV